MPRKIEQTPARLIADRPDLVELAVPEHLPTEVSSNFRFKHVAANRSGLLNGAPVGLPVPLGIRFSAPEAATAPETRFSGQGWPSGKPVEARSQSQETVLSAFRGPRGGYPPLRPLNGSQRVSGAPETPVLARSRRRSAPCSGPESEFCLSRVDCGSDALSICGHQTFQICPRVSGRSVPGLLQLVPARPGSKLKAAAGTAPRRTGRAGQQIDRCRVGAGDFPGLPKRDRTFALARSRRDAAPGPVAGQKPGATRVPRKVEQTPARPHRRSGRSWSNWPCRFHSAPEHLPTEVSSNFRFKHVTANRSGLLNGAQMPTRPAIWTALDAVGFQFVQQLLDGGPGFGIVRQMPDGGNRIVEASGRLQAVAGRAGWPGLEPDQFRWPVASRLLASDLRPLLGQQCVACLAFEFGCNPCRDLWFKFPPCLGLDLGQTLCNRVWLPRDFLEGGFVFWFHPESEPFQPFGFSCLNEFALIFVLVILVHGLPLSWKHPC